MREDMWTRRIGVEVRVAREMARLVASASAICGREVAWNLGRLWPREMRRFVILTSLVQHETACNKREWLEETWSGVFTAAMRAIKS
jgi:hypothetical protein